MKSGQHGGHAPPTTADAPVLPVPTLDHVVVNVRDQMEDAFVKYCRLGFSLTPLGRHTLGSINHLAVFGTDYLELLGLPQGSTARTELSDGPLGLSGIALGTHDADGVQAALAAAGAPVLPPLAFSRPVELPGGARDASFRVVRLAREGAVGRFFFCGHLTRDVVWRDEWRRHPNGVLGIAGIVIAAERPDTLGDFFASLFGRDAVVPIAGGLRLGLGLTRLEVVTPAEVVRRFAAAAPAPDGRAEAMVGLVLRTAGLARAEAALRAGGPRFVREPERLLVPPAEACGVALEFCE